MFLSVAHGSHVEIPVFPGEGEASRKGGGKATTDSQEYTEYLPSACTEWGWGVAGRKQEELALCFLHGRTMGQDEGH